MHTDKGPPEIAQHGQYISNILCKNQFHIANKCLRNY